jgi:predicted nuclease of restriction endonuclease-like RecB superfamily
LPGEVVCVPDLLFSSRETGEQIYLEAFGFWSRAAVWQRIETIARGSMPARLILAVSKQLRVSEELLGEQEAGELYVYRTRMSPRAILDRLERR